MSKASGKSKAAERAARVAAERAEQLKREQRRRLLTIVGVLVAIALIVGGAIVYSVWSEEEIEAAPAGTSDYGVTYGEKESPREIVIYEDFLCPICGQLEEASSEGLEKAAREGRVIVDYRPVAILNQYGDYSLRAANAFKVVLDAGGAATAKEFHDLLFKNQPNEQGPYLSDDQLIDLAVEAGAAEGEVRSGIEELSQKAWVDKATKAAAKEGLTGTPVVLLDGKPFADGQSWEEIGENLVTAVE